MPKMASCIYYGTINQGAVGGGEPRACFWRLAFRSHRFNSEGLSGSRPSFPIISFRPRCAGRSRAVTRLAMPHLHLSPAIMFVTTGLVIDEIGLRLFNL